MQTIYIINNIKEDKVYKIYKSKYWAEKKFNEILDISTDYVLIYQTI